MARLFLHKRMDWQIVRRKRRKVETPNGGKYAYGFQDAMVSVRAIWSDAGLKDGEKVENLKWLNEILGISF